MERERDLERLEAKRKIDALKKTVGQETTDTKTKVQEVRGMGGRRKGEGRWREGDGREGEEKGRWRWKREEGGRRERGREKGKRQGEGKEGGRREGGRRTEGEGGREERRKTEVQEVSGWSRHECRY